MSRTPLLVALAAMTVLPLHAGVIFSEDFSSVGTTDLHATFPDTTLGGAPWVASANFNVDGSIDQGSGSATLGFTPVDGLVYTLEASITGISGDNNWFALGFTNGQSGGSTGEDRFISGNVVGTAWMLVRGDASVNSNTAFLGTGVLGTGNNGITSGASWADTVLGSANPGGDMDLRVVLDTTGGAGNWTATYYAKRPTDGAYTVVRDTMVWADSTDAGGVETDVFTSVGLALSNSGVFGNIQSFSLSEDSPPDATAPMLSSTTPADDAGNVPVGSNLVASFDEPVQLGTGNITIRRSGDDSVFATYAVTDAPEVSLSAVDSITLNPAGDLEYSTGYYVQIEGTAIEDLAGNAFSGIGDTSTWSFTTGAAPVAGVGPYTADANTLHLWHFDEADPGPAAPASAVTGSFNLTPDDGKSPGFFATLGDSAFSGFGTAGGASAGQGSGFKGVSIPVSSVTGTDGAFTFEAMIAIANTGDIQQILSMEGNATGARPFQFRIDGGSLRFINIDGGGGTVLGAIPTTGPDAFVAGEWFHVAVTYTGAAGVPDNTTLYWTRVDPTRTEASLLATGTMTADLSGTTVFGVGNNYRTAGSGNTNNLEGRVDEVRISDIARGPGDFVLEAPDTDNDGLADPWEILHFRDNPGESDAVILAKYDGTDDPDNDTFDNEAEETAGTDPNDDTHTPEDVDKDGYLDSWELATFGTIAYGPTDDPDGDGFDTATELAAGTDPANSLSNPDDTDADGMDDATEIALFGNLSQGPLDDFDGDGVSNIGEIQEGTDPTDPRDFPLVSFIPVTDGNAATDEQGYAGSAINSIAFAQNNLITVNGQQFISYYRRHATDSGHPDNNTVLVGRRNVGETQWELFSTNFYSVNINDTHNVISMAIDGDGFLHMAWGVHAHPLLYAKSTTSVLGTDPIVMTSLGTAGMTGQETQVTYPKFQTLPDGDVVFLYREIGSGNGDWYLSRYDIDTDTWAPVHDNGSGAQVPLMKGTGDSPNNCWYPDRMTLGPDGMLHMSGVYRYNGDSLAGESGFQTNHRYVYMRSPDGGTSWERSDGSAIDIPAVEAAWFQSLGADHVPEIVEDLPEGHSIINESGMTTDSLGRPIIANWWADSASSGDHTRQYFIYFHDGTTWHKRQVSERDIDNPATKYSEGLLGSSRMGRPVVLTDDEDRIIVVYNDNRFPGITVVFSEPLAQDPERNNWTRMNITNENLGNWETTYDEKRWKQDRVLHMLYQQLPGMGLSFGGQNNSTPVSVVEWNARAYFNSPIRWDVDTKTTPEQAIVSAQTRIGFRYDLKSNTDLDFSGPPVVTLPGDGTWLDFGTWPMNEVKRFWKLERVEEATNDL